MAKKPYDPITATAEETASHILEDFNHSLKKVNAVVRSDALERFQRRFERREHIGVGEAILLSIAEAEESAARSLRNTVKKHGGKAVRKHEEQLREQEIDAFSENAASAAFPGVEDEDG
jgi:hypothetical protein